MFTKEMAKKIVAELDPENPYSSYCKICEDLDRGFDSLSQYKNEEGEFVIELTPKSINDFAFIVHKWDELAGSFYTSSIHTTEQGEWEVEGTFDFYRDIFNVPYELIRMAYEHRNIKTGALILNLKDFKEALDDAVAHYLEEHDAEFAKLLTPKMTPERIAKIREALSGTTDSILWRVREDLKAGVPDGRITDEAKTRYMWMFAGFNMFPESYRLYGDGEYYFRFDPDVADIKELIRNNSNIDVDDVEQKDEDLEIDKFAVLAALERKVERYLKELDRKEKELNAN